MVLENSTAVGRVARLFLIAGFLLLPTGVSSAITQDAAALQWFKAEVPEGAASAQFRWAIDPSAVDAESAELTIVTDDHCSLYVNGQRILKNAALKQADGNVEAAGYNVRSLLRQGRNLIAVEVNSEDKVAVFGLSMSARKGNEIRNIGGGWKKAPALPPVGWQQTDFNDRDWPEVKTVADEPGNRFKVSMPTAFAAPVIPAKARTAPFQFEDGDRVVFVGATFFERAQLSEHLEATLAGTLGNKQVIFRNLGWSADTTYADSRGIFDRPEVGYLRMVEHIRAEEPTVAIICYGQNEALTAGLTPEQYSDQLGRLLDELTASGIACVLVSPHELLPAIPPVPSPSRFNSRIKVYSETTGSVAQSRGLLFVDVFSGFTRQLRDIDFAINSCYKMPPEVEEKQGDSDSSSNWIYHSLAENGMHFTDYGYACASIVFRDRLLNIPANLPVVEVDGSAKTVTSTDAEIRNVKWNPDDSTMVSFEVQEKMLSALPLVISAGAASAKDVQLHGGVISLGETSQQLRQRSFLVAKESQFKQGRSFAAEVNPQYEAMRKLLLKKNELYFHRWRPQNITYLFGFRKHEQGNNAADIAKFDPFIQDLEKQIHELQQPQWRTVVLKTGK
ncbi:MAG: GDSL-type esterase/lipase family protein [Planctomycetaceae bacterium]